MDKRWEFGRPDPAAVDRVARDGGFPPRLAHVLAVRGIADVAAARAFLNPLLANLTDPSRMTDMDRAAERLARAVRDRERIAVFGDYDVDGVTSVALLLTFLRGIGAEAVYHIPNRMTEGYGLNRPAIDGLADQGARVMVTVDCGIADLDAIDHAAGRGIDVIVTDHHQVGPRLPAAYAIVNPNRADCAFPFKHLAGVGLAFYLAIALRGALDRGGVLARGDAPDLKGLLDLVALGTVADVSPLAHENRILTRHGLALLTQETRLGIRALKEAARIGKKAVTAGTIAFQLGPRINAAGRLGSPDLGVRLLTTDGVAEALQIAHELEAVNQERQHRERQILDDARAMLLSDKRLPERAAIVLASDRWHPGVVGIVASKIVEEFRRPAILIAMKDGTGRGSARSVPRFNVHEAIGACAEHLLSFGGHQEAAGLRIDAANLDDFRRAMERVASERLAGVDTRPVVAVDLEMPLAEANEALIDLFADMAPFGMGNPEPVFAARGVEVRRKRVVGARHAKLTLVADGREFEAMWFNQAAALKDLPARVDVAYQPKRDTYLGATRIVLHVRDLRPAE
jgi:single-stranded-DNA-specific exonuclease